MLELTYPLTVAVFFAGLALTIKFTLPRWQDIRRLRTEIDVLMLQIRACQETAAGLTKLTERIETTEMNIKTLHGNLVTVRDQVQFKGIAGALRGQPSK